MVGESCYSRNRHQPLFEMPPESLLHPLYSKIFQKSPFPNAGAKTRASTAINLIKMFKEGPCIQTEGTIN